MLCIRCATQGQTCCGLVLRAVNLGGEMYVCKHVYVIKPNLIQMNGVHKLN